MRKKFTIFLILIFVLGLVPINFSWAITQNQINAEVQIVCPDNYGNWFSGSGTIIDPKGIILTNKHVVTDEKGGIIKACFIGFIESINTEPNFGTDSNPNIAEVKYYTSTNDMDAAILYLDNKSNKSYPYVDIWNSDSNKLVFGDKLEVIGFPGIGGSTVTYTSGDFSGFGSTIDGTQNYIKASTPLEHGNSGGATYNPSGQFIGIPTMVVRGTLNSLSYILSVNSIKSWLSGVLGSNYQQEVIEQKPVIETPKVIIQNDITPPINGNCQVFIDSEKKQEGNLSFDSNVFVNTFEEPFFSVSGTTDEASGVAGYYYYFGDNISAIPKMDGQYSELSSYQKTKIYDPGLYYFIFSAKDNSGNISEPKICPYLFNKEGFYPQRLDIYDNKNKDTYIHTRYNTSGNVISPTILNTDRKQLFLDWSNNNLNGINGFYIYIGDKNTIKTGDLSDFVYTKNPYYLANNLKAGIKYVYVIAQYDNNYKSVAKYLITLKVSNNPLKTIRDIKLIEQYSGYVIKDVINNKYYYLSTSGILHDFRATEDEIIPLIKKDLTFQGDPIYNYKKHRGDFYKKSGELFYVKDNLLNVVRIETFNDLNKYIKNISFDIYKFGTDEDLSNKLMDTLTGKNLVDNNFVNRLKGKILLRVESRGEAYYINPKDGKKYYMADGNGAYGIMRYMGVGIINNDLNKIKNDKSFAKKYSGKIFLQVESHGEAYYIDFSGNAHYLKDGGAAYTIMRELGLGITNSDLNKIQEGRL